MSAPNRPFANDPRAPVAQRNDSAFDPSERSIGWEWFSPTVAIALTAFVLFLIRVVMTGLGDTRSARDDEYERRRAVDEFIKHQWAMERQREGPEALKELLEESRRRRAPHPSSKSAPSTTAPSKTTPRSRAAKVADP